MWKWFLVICLCLAAFGCTTAEEQARLKAKAEADVEAQKAEAEKTKAEIQSKLDMLRKGKILNVRKNSQSIDLILEDGAIITIFVDSKYTPPASGQRYGTTNYFIGIK